MPNGRRSGDDVVRTVLPSIGAEQRSDIKPVTIRTHEACIRIIDKSGTAAIRRIAIIAFNTWWPSRCFIGRLTAADYEDTVAGDPRIDACAPRSLASRIRAYPGLSRSGRSAVLRTRSRLS